MMTPVLSLLQSTSAWVWTASWQATVIAVLVMITQWTFRRRISARWRNALWLLVFARLLMPVLPQARFSAYNWLPGKAPVSPVALKVSEEIPPSPVTTELPEIAKPDDRTPFEAIPIANKARRQVWQSIPLLPLAWGTGFLAVLGSGAVGYVRLRRRVTQFQQNVPAALCEQFDAAKAELRVSRADLVVSEAVTTPMVTGLWRARIVLPVGLESTLPSEDIRMVILHELAHVKRGDLWMAWLAWIAGALHWFNPVIRFVIARARKDREMACDEWVLRFISDSHAYGSALVRFLESRQAPTPQLGTIGIFESKSSLVQRVKRIAAYRRPNVWGSAIGVTLLVMVGALTLTGASDSKPTPKAPSVSAQDALMQAIADNDVSKARKALDDGAEANTKGYSYAELVQCYPMWLAVRHGSLELVRLLVDHGGEIAPKGSCGSFTQYALQNGLTDLAKYLHSQNESSCDPLVFAAGIGDLKTITKLKAAAKPNVLCEAANAAAAGSQLSALDVLIGKPVDPDEVFDQAAVAGAVKSMRFLLAHGADIKKSGDKALASAAYNKQTAAVAFLLTQGVNPNGAKPPAMLPLHSAAQEGGLDAVKLLLEAGADPNALDEQGYTPLVAALFRDRVEIARLLLDHGARTDITDKHDWSSLCNAAASHAPRCIELLIERGADIKFSPPGMRSVLAMAQSFIGEDALPQKDRNEFRNPSAISKAVETVKILLDKGADINGPGNDGMSPLAAAAANGQTAIFDLLLERGADVNRRDDEGGTPLIRAVMPYFKDKPRLGMIDKLLAKGADINVGADNPSVKGGTPSALKAVMIGGISGGSAGSEPSPIDAARKLVTKLLKHGARFPVPRDSDEEHLLIAAADGELGTVQKLLSRGVSPDVSDSKGWTPLMSASALGYSEIMRILVDAGANVSAHDAAGLTPLWLTISSNPNAADIQLLLNKGADVNANADFFGPVLYMAVERNDVDLVRDILKRGANPNVCRNLHGVARWPVHESVWGGRTNPAITKLLLEYGADPNPKCNENRSPLYWAINHKQTETVKELLKAGADPRKVDDYNESISQMADLSDNQEIKSLIKAALETTGTPGKPLKAPATASSPAISKAEKGLFELHGVADAAGPTTVDRSLPQRNGESETVHLESEVLLDHNALMSVKVGHDENGYYLRLTLDEEGAKRFGDITARRIGERIGIVADGKLLSAPVVRDPIFGGSLMITGNFTEKEATDLAAKLNQAIRSAPSATPSSPAPKEAPGGDQTQKSAAKPEAKTVTIHVLDSDGSPLSGASAKAEGPNISVELITGSDGLATVSLPTARPQYLAVRVHKNGYVPKIIHWSLDQPSFSLPSDFTLKMERAQSIGGVVKNDDGQPVAAAKVVLIIRGSSMGVSQEVFDDIWERRVTTDKEGMWHFDEAPSDLRPLSVKLEHPDYISNVDIDPLPSNVDFKNHKAVLIAHRGTPVDGTVTDESGKPLSGVDVTFGESGSDSTTYPSIKTDAAGHFHFGALSMVQNHWLPPILTFTAPNYAPEMVKLKTLVGPQTLQVQLKAGKPLRLRFIDQQGHPIKGVTVVADYWRRHRPFGCIRFNSDKDGQIVWKHAPDEPITYAVMSDSFQREDMIFQPTDAVQTIVLKRPTVVAGHVVDATTKQSIPGFDLIFGTYFPTMHPFWSSWARGAALHIKSDSYRYVFEGPAIMGSAGNGPGTEGFHRIRIEAPGYEPAVSRPIANNEEEVSIDLQLKPASAIHGIVTASDGTPVKGAQIVVAGPGNALQIVNGVSQSKWDQLSVNTNDQGEYDLPPQEEDFPIAIIQPEAGYFITTYRVLKSSPNVKLLPWGELRLVSAEPSDAKSEYYIRYVHEDEAADEKARIRFEVDKPSEVQNGVATYRLLVAGTIKVGQSSRDIDGSQVVQIENGKTTRVKLNSGGAQQSPTPLSTNLK